MEVFLPTIAIFNRKCIRIGSEAADKSDDNKLLVTIFFLSENNV